MSDTQTVEQALADATPPKAKNADLVPVGTAAVAAVKPDQEWWTPRQMSALKALGIKRANNEDLLLYLHYCQKTGLDPFAKQIYLIERKSWDKAEREWVYTQTIQVGIDGFRVSAQRAAAKQGVQIEYAQTIWYAQDGSKHEVWLDNDNPPAAALVIIYKVLPSGQKLPVPGLAKFESYAAYATKKGKDGEPDQKWLQSQWGTMPDHMIEKCAEAFALRRAFPNDLGGVYIEEEMQRYEPLGDAPRLKGRTHSDTAAEEAIVDGEVVEDEAPAAEGNGDESVVPRDQSTAKMAAVFREHGLGAKNHLKMRRAIVTGLMNEEKEPPTEYVSLEAMGDARLAEAADRVASFCDRLSDGDGNSPVEQLIDYGNSIIQAVEAR